METNTLSIKQNMLWNSAGSFINLICQWLITVLVVRLSKGFDAAGQLSLAMAIANVFAPIAMYKMRSFQVSDVKQSTSASEYIGFRLVTIALGLGLSAVYALATLSFDALPVVGLYLLYKTIDCFIDVYHGIDQQNLRMDYCGKSLAMRGVLSLLSFSATLAFTNSLAFAIASMCIATAPVLLYDRHAAAQFACTTPRISIQKAKQLLVSCLPAVVGTACCTAVVTVARQNLDSLLGTEILGIYASVCTPVVIVQAGAGYIYSPLLGVFAESFERGDARKFLSLLKRVTAALLGLTVAGCLAFLLVGKPFLSLVFGREIAPYAYLMYAAILSVILCAYASFLTDLLIAVKRVTSTLTCNLISLGIVFAGSVPAIRIFGINGTSMIIALAFFISSLAMLAICLKAIHNHGNEPEHA